jgi:hypothetical protein
MRAAVVDFTASRQSPVRQEVPDFYRVYIRDPHLVRTLKIPHRISLIENTTGIYYNCDAINSVFRIDYIRIQPFGRMRIRIQCGSGSW